jgi:NAD(P)-dependent dehydrogenase (short-subunit alcohol dehydrogenase family)
VVLIEPGFIKTSALNSANSPYSQLMQNVISHIEHAMKTGSPPDVVAKAVLKAVTSENPSMRYLAGKDAEKWMEAKRGMSDEESHKMMKQNMMK